MIERRYTDRMGRTVGAGDAPSLVLEIRGVRAAAKGLGLRAPQVLARDGRLTAESLSILDKALDIAGEALTETEAPPKPERRTRGRFWGLFGGN